MSYEDLINTYGGLAVSRALWQLGYEMGYPDPEDPVCLAALNTYFGG